MAIKSSINVRTASKTISSLSNGISKSQSLAGSISSTLSKRNSFKKNSISQDRIIFNKRREAVRRREQESIIEASTVQGISRRTSIPSGGAIVESTKGFFGRILDFAATIMIGWMANNLPFILVSAQNLITRIGTVVSVLSGTNKNGFMAYLNGVFGEMGDVLTSITTNISNFDFTDQSGEVRRSFSELTDSFTTLGGSFDEAVKLFTVPLGEGPGEKTPPAPGTQYPGQVIGEESALPSQGSPEMYRIAAALSTEGSGPQSTVDMMQVVVNRKASGRYGATYTDVLSAGTGGKNVAFEGVWKRPGGPRTFRQIQTLEDAAKWSGQSKETLLRIISDIQNPTLQANSAKFVGGAFDFRASPQNNPNGRLPGTAWRGGAGDNQFLTDPSRGDPIRKEGPAPFNLPAPVQQPQRPQAPVSTGTMRLIPQTGSGGFIQGGSGNGRDDYYATHFHIDAKSANPTQEQLANIREVAFQAVKAMFARGSWVHFGNIKRDAYKGISDSDLRSLIAAEQRSHDQRSSPGVDIQEHNPKIQRTFPSQPGSKTKFPFAVGSVYYRGGYGYEAEIIGTNQITVSHGSPESRASDIAGSQETVITPSLSSSATQSQELVSPEDQTQQQSIGLLDSLFGFSMLSSLSSSPTAQVQPPELSSSIIPQAQIIQAPSDTSSQVRSITPERVPNQVIVSPQQMQQPNNTPPVAPPTRASKSSLSPEIMLNRFMLNRLLLDLAYT